MSLFKKKPSDFDEQENQGSGKSKGSLVVLLVLLGGLAYLYFFTSLIVPHEVPIAKTPDLPLEVKQSMPPKPADQPAAPATVPAEATPTAPAVPGAAMPIAPPPAPFPAAAKPAEPTVPASAAAKKVVPAITAPAAARPAATAVAAKPQLAAKPAAVAPVIAASAAVKKETPKTAPGVQKKPTAKSANPVSVVKKQDAVNKVEAYTLLAGVFSVAEEATAAEAKLARLGIKPITRNEIKKNGSMNRLFYGAYTDYDLYLAELDKLRKSAKGAFGIEKNGTYSLYAGSFAAKAGADKEKRTLDAKGINLQIQQTVLALTTVKLTAGRYASKKEADNAAAKVKSEGLAVKVVPTGR